MKGKCAGASVLLRFLRVCVCACPPSFLLRERNWQMLHAKKHAWSAQNLISDKDSQYLWQIKNVPGFFSIFSPFPSQVGMHTRLFPFSLLPLTEVLW